MHARLVSSQLDVFLQTLLTPMAQVKSLASFYQQLSYCMAQYVEKVGPKPMLLVLLIDSDESVTMWKMAGPPSGLWYHHLHAPLLASLQLRFWEKLLLHWSFDSCHFQFLRFLDTFSTFTMDWGVHHIKAGSLPQRTWGLNMTIINLGCFFLILHDTLQYMSCRLAKKTPDDAHGCVLNPCSRRPWNWLSHRSSIVCRNGDLETKRSEVHGRHGMAWMAWILEKIGERSNK